MSPASLAGALGSATRRGTRRNLLAGVSLACPGPSQGSLSSPRPRARSAAVGRTAFPPAAAPGAPGGGRCVGGAVVLRAVDPA